MGRSWEGKNQTPSILSEVHHTIPVSVRLLQRHLQLEGLGLGTNGPFFQGQPESPVLLSPPSHLHTHTVVPALNNLLLAPHPAQSGRTAQRTGQPSDAPLTQHPRSTKVQPDIRPLFTTTGSHWSHPLHVDNSVSSNSRGTKRLHAANYVLLTTKPSRLENNLFLKVIGMAIPTLKTQTNKNFKPTSDPWGKTTKKLKQN